MINSSKIKLSPTGGAGVAAANGHIPFIGKILAILLIPTGMPATMDTTITITQDGDSTTDIETVATFTNQNANTKHYPRVLEQDNTGANLTTYDKFATVNGIEVTVAQADNGTDSVEVEVIYETDFSGA